MPAYLCIHDLSWRDLPGEFPWRNRMMRHMSTRKALKKAAGVVCVSRFTQERLLHHYEVDPRKVRVIPSGLSPQWKRAGRQEIKDFRSRLKLDDQMVVGYLGTLLPRRHIREMLESFALLNRRFPAWLVVVGENRIGPEIEPMLHQPGVIWLPRLEEKDLTAFYSSLDLFLYLSEYEGFGFPPLEALACGTPALVLEGSSLSEFTGDFAATTPCFHPQALAEQITGLLTTERSRATQGIDRFRNQRQQFSWERSAQSHLELMGLLGSAGKG